MPYGLTSAPVLCNLLGLGEGVFFHPTNLKSVMYPIQWETPDVKGKVDTLQK